MKKIIKVLVWSHLIIYEREVEIEVVFLFLVRFVLFAFLLLPQKLGEYENPRIQTKLYTYIIFPLTLK